jgi:hypothetical protein
MRFTIWTFFGLIFFGVVAMNATKSFAPLERLYVNLGFITDPNTIMTNIGTVQWRGEERTLLVSVSNTTSEPYHRFNLDCETHEGRIFSILDRSGIRPDRQNDVRVYRLSNAAISNAKFCVTADVERGKPTPWLPGMEPRDNDDRLAITDAEIPEDIE